MSDTELADRLREEVELARALTAILLAARLEVAETKAQRAYENLIGKPAAARAR